MANEFFVVKNGLEVGSVSIDAATGNITVPAGSSITVGTTVLEAGNVVSDAADKLATARNITLTGDASGSASFDGTADASITVAVADNSHNHTSANVSDATSANTASTIVKRGASGEFSAGAATLASASISGLVSAGSLSTTGAVTIGGNLTVNGTTTTINAATLAVTDLNVTVAKDASTAAAANGAGLTVAGANATFTYTSADDRWNLNKNLNVSTVYGNVTGNLTGAVTGNASTATALQTSRTISLSGDVTGSASFDGSANATITATIAANSVALGTDTTGNYVANVANGAYITGGSAGSEGAALTIAVDATSANTASKVVARDASGNFSAGTITATLSGNATNITAYTINQNVGTANSPTFAGVTVPSIAHSGTTGVGDIGSVGNTFGTVYATATSAKYADLAEKYVADAEIVPGTVVCFGGNKEVTTCNVDQCTAIAGVVSTAPAYIMNAECSGEFVTTVAFTGRVPCKVVGKVRKGDMMVSAGNGAARAEANPKVGSVIGKALENFDGETGVIEVVVGK